MALQEPLWSSDRLSISASPPPWFPGLEKETGAALVAPFYRPFE